MRTIPFCFFTGGLFLIAATFFFTFYLEEKGKEFRKNPNVPLVFPGPTHDPKPPETAPKLP